MALENSTDHGLVNNTPRARVVRHLQEWMEDGRLIAGSRLPPEKQLADKLNVSRTTIRLALADLDRQGFIHSSNRQWIVKAHISPSRSLLSDCVSLVVESIDSPMDYTHTLHNPWHISFVHMGALLAIRKAGYDTFIVHPDRIGEDLVQRMIAQRPKGAIILSRVLQERSGKYLGRALQQGNIPYVIYGDMGLPLQNAEVIAGVDSVTSDHESGSYELTKWLISQGRKRILRFWEIYLGGPQKRPYWLVQRDLGYERAMREAGLEPIPALEIYNPTYQHFGVSKQDFDFRSRIMAGYLVEYVQGPNAIDAIMALSDEIVGQLSAALRVHGKLPNDDVLLVGYDNMWDDLEEVRQWEPLGPVATVDKRNMEIGSNLMSLLQKRIHGELFKEGELRVIKPDLILRPSAYPGGQLPAPVRQRVE